MDALSHKSWVCRFLRKDRDGFTETRDRAYTDRTASPLADLVDVEDGR
jgi:hypothetical protein